MHFSGLTKYGMAVKFSIWFVYISHFPDFSLRASEWKLDAPDWTGRLRVIAVSNDVFIKLEDKTSGNLYSLSILLDHIEYCYLLDKVYHTLKDSC